MRVVKLTGPKMMECADMPMPEPDGVYVIIRTSACGICGSDLHYWSLGVGMDGRPGLVMGHEFCGTVHDPGSRADLSAGDRVTALPIDPCGECYSCTNGFENICSMAPKRAVAGNSAPGAYAEYVRVRPDMVRALPGSIDDTAAALIEPSAVALHAVNQAEVRPGDKVLVSGGGPIGLLCAAWAKARGASLVALAEIDGYRLAFAAKSGYADSVIHAHDPAFARTLKKLSGGGFDRALETSASDAGIRTVMSALRPHGRMVLAGINFGNQSVATLLFTVKELEQRASMGYRVDEFDEVIGRMAQGKFDPSALVTGSVALRDVPAAFERLASGEMKEMKTIIRF